MRVHKTKKCVKILNKQIINKNGIIGSVLYSISYGKFKVIKEIGMDKKHNMYYEIEFINTGYRNNVRRSHMINGSVMDRLYDEDIIIGKKYSSLSYGDFIVMDFIGRKKPYSEKIYKIKFIKTGYETLVLKDSIIHGTIKDPLVISACGVGFLGDKYKEISLNDNELCTAMNSRWHLMLHRCYDKTHKSYPNYGLLGVKVDERWHNFSNFYYDIISLENFDKEKFIKGELVLDKDKKQLDIPTSRKIYSKDTVTLMSPSENFKLIKRSTTIPRQ